MFVVVLVCVFFENQNDEIFRSLSFWKNIGFCVSSNARVCVCGMNLGQRIIELYGMETG
jgi:hypothetical protein